MRALRLAAALCILSCLAEGVAAHTRSQSYSTWTRVGAQLHVVVTAPAREVARLASGSAAGDFGQQLAEHLDSRLHAWSGERACQILEPPRPLAASPGSARAELRMHCAGTGAIRIEVDAFFDAIPGHVHFARVREGSASAEHLLGAGARSATGPTAARPDAPAGALFADYVRLGVEHIAGGFDHLAFLVGLLLVCTGAREILWVATGFTLGHSITLGLAVVGWVRPEARLVEALIGFTIALVAAESAARRAGGARAIGAALACGLAIFALQALGRGDAAGALAFGGLALFAPSYLRLCEVPARARALRPSLTLAFGWIHGFGFASQLLGIGVPQDRVLGALLGFNVGVELGQIAALAVFWGAGRWLALHWRGLPRSLALDGVSAALCALGIFWFASRAQG